MKNELMNKTGNALRKAAAIAIAVPSSMIVMTASAAADVATVVAHHLSEMIRFEVTTVGEIINTDLSKNESEEA